VLKLVGERPLIATAVSGFGTFLMGISLLLFAIIKPTLPYWAYSFPSTLLIVFGADFVFAPGTLLIAKVTPPHEQSVAGAVFQTMTLIGTAVGISISTIVYNGVLGSKSREAGVAYDPVLNNAPRGAQLTAYRDAFWTGVAFAVFCACSLAIFDALLFIELPGLILCLTLRGVGIVGAPPNGKRASMSSGDPEEMPQEQEKAAVVL